MFLPASLEASAVIDDTGPEGTATVLPASVIGLS